MKHMPVKLIVMDMDGTLLNSEQRVSPATLKVLQRAEKSGIHLAVCSGRMPGDIERFVTALDECYLLSLNGMYCLEKMTKAPFLSHVMEQADAQSCIRLLENENMTYGCFSENRLVLRQGQTQTCPADWGCTGEGQYPSELIRAEGDPLSYCPNGIHKIVCLSQQHEQLALVKRTLLNETEMEITSSWQYNLELMPKGCSKLTAVKKLAERLHVPMGQVMAIGDYDNDASMLSGAGIGVAMGNATEDVKRSADEITLSNDENGVAFAIEKWAF